MSKQSPIGIFDSGIGGMTVAKAVSQLLPNERIIYFGDTAHFPYGDKSQAAIQAYSVKICTVLLKHNCKVILMACNSASASAFELVKEYVGSKAIVINVIDPVVNFLKNEFSTKHVGLIGTKRTITSNVYQVKVDATEAGIQLSSLATPLLAPMIEEGFFNHTISETIIDNYLKDDILKGVDALVLGCTHYPLIKDQIEDFYKGSVSVIDSSEIVAMDLQKKLEEKQLLSDKKEGKHTFYVSDFTISYQQSTKIFFGEEVELEQYRLWE